MELVGVATFLLCVGRSQQTCHSHYTNCSYRTCIYVSVSSIVSCIYIIRLLRAVSSFPSSYNDTTHKVSRSYHDMTTIEINAISSILIAP